MSFAKKLDELMKSLDMSQTKLSEMTGIGKSSISQYLSGRNVPNVYNLERIADALNVSVDWLSGRVDELKVEVGAVKNLSVGDAARLMGVGKQCVREGLKNGSLPFGCAVKMPQGNYRYYISPKRFTEFTGVEI